MAPFFLNRRFKSGIKCKKKFKKWVPPAPHRLWKSTKFFSFIPRKRFSNEFGGKRFFFLEKNLKINQAQFAIPPPRYNKKPRFPDFGAKKKWRRAQVFLKKLLPPVKSFNS